MANALENALQKALSVRLNLQISLSQLPIIEEWMDIHLDRWLEHNPTPPDMPNGEGVSYLAMLGSDLRRIWWARVVIRAGSCRACPITSSCATSRRASRSCSIASASSSSRGSSD